MTDPRPGTPVKTVDSYRPISELGKALKHYGGTVITWRRSFNHNSADIRVHDTFGNSLGTISVHHKNLITEQIIPEEIRMAYPAPYIPKKGDRVKVKPGSSYYAERVGTVLSTDTWNTVKIQFDNLDGTVNVFSDHLEHIGFTPEPKIKNGDRVTVIDGPYKGHYGYAETVGSSVARVNLDQGGQAKSLQLVNLELACGQKKETVTAAEQQRKSTVTNIYNRRKAIGQSIDTNNTTIAELTAKNDKLDSEYAELTAQLEAINKL